MDISDVEIDEGKLFKKIHEKKLKEDKDYANMVKLTKAAIKKKKELDGEIEKLKQQEFALYLYEKLLEEFLNNLEKGQEIGEIGWGLDFGAISRAFHSAVSNVTKTVSRTVSAITRSIPRPTPKPKITKKPTPTKKPTLKPPTKPPVKTRPRVTRPTRYYIRTKPIVKKRVTEKRVEPLLRTKRVKPKTTKKPTYRTKIKKAYAEHRTATIIPKTLSKVKKAAAKTIVNAAKKSKGSPTALNFEVRKMQNKVSTVRAEINKKRKKLEEEKAKVQAMGLFGAGAIINNLASDVWKRVAGVPEWVRERVTKRISEFLVGAQKKAEELQKKGGEYIRNIQNLPGGVVKWLSDRKKDLEKVGGNVAKAAGKILEPVVKPVTDWIAQGSKALGAVWGLLTKVPGFTTKFVYYATHPEEARKYISRNRSRVITFVKKYRELQRMPTPKDPKLARKRREYLNKYRLYYQILTNPIFANVLGISKEISGVEDIEGVSDVVSAAIAAVMWALIPIIGPLLSFIKTIELAKALEKEKEVKEEKVIPKPKPIDVYYYTDKSALYLILREDLGNSFNAFLSDLNRIKDIRVVKTVDAVGVTVIVDPRDSSTLRAKLTAILKNLGFEPRFVKSEELKEYTTYTAEEYREAYLAKPTEEAKPPEEKKEEELQRKFAELKDLVFRAWSEGLSIAVVNGTNWRIGPKKGLSAPPDDVIHIKEDWRVNKCLQILDQPWQYSSVGKKLTKQVLDRINAKKETYFDRWYLDTMTQRGTEYTRPLQELWNWFYQNFGEEIQKEAYAALTESSYEAPEVKLPESEPIPKEEIPEEEIPKEEIPKEEIPTEERPPTEEEIAPIRFEEEEIPEVPTEEKIKPTEEIPQEILDYIKFYEEQIPKLEAELQSLIEKRRRLEQEVAQLMKELGLHIELRPPVAGIEEISEIIL